MSWSSMGRTALYGVQYTTDTIDFTATQTAVLRGPLFPGMVGISSLVKMVSVSKAGSITAAFTFNAGNDASNNTWVASNTPNTNLFSTAGTNTGGSIGAASQPLSMTDMGTAGSVVITAGATGTGGFAWTGRICVYVLLIPTT